MAKVRSGGGKNSTTGAKKRTHQFNKLSTAPF